MTAFAKQRATMRRYGILRILRVETYGNRSIWNAQLDNGDCARAPNGERERRTTGSDGNSQAAFSSEGEEAKQMSGSVGACFNCGANGYTGRPCPACGQYVPRPRDVLAAIAKQPPKNGDKK